MQKEIFVEGKLLQDNWGGSVPMPDDYKIGTKIVPILHWIPDTNNHGKVCWYLYHTWSTPNNQFPAEDKIQNVGTTQGIARQYFADEMSKLPSISNEHSLLKLRVIRDFDSDDDTYDGEAVLLGLTLIYETK